MRPNHKGFFSKSFKKAWRSLERDISEKGYEIWKKGVTNEKVVITKTYYDDNGKFKFDWEIPEQPPPQACVETKIDPD